MLQWKSCRLPHVSLSYTTYFQVQWHTHTDTYETRQTCTCAHKTHKKMTKTHTQVIHSLLLTPWLEACRHTGLTTHTHPALPTSVTLLFLYRALSGREEKTVKKKKKTPCWLWFSGVTSPTQNVLVTPEYLVSACSILRSHAHPGSHFRLLKACILEQSQAEMNFQSIQELEL